MYLVCIQESVYAASFSQKLANKYCENLPPVKRQRSQIEEGGLRNWEETIPPNVVVIDYDKNKNRIFISKNKDRVYGWWVGECPLLVFPEDAMAANNWIG